MNPVTEALNACPDGTMNGKSTLVTQILGNWYTWTSSISASFPLYRILPERILNVKLVLLPGSRDTDLKFQSSLFGIIPVAWEATTTPPGVTNSIIKSGLAAFIVVLNKLARYKSTFTGWFGITSAIGLLYNTP